MRPASLISALFLCVIAVGHLARLALRVPVMVNGIGIPLWPSLFAAVFTGALAFFLWREGRTGRPAGTARPR